MKNVLKNLVWLLLVPSISFAAGKATVSSENRTAVPIAGVQSDGTMVPVKVDADGVVQVSGAGGGASAFTDLTDAPASYTGQAGNFVKVNSGETGLEFGIVAGFGDVVGPASSTDNALVRFNSTTGKLIQNSVGILNDTGDLSGISTIAISDYVEFLNAITLSTSKYSVGQETNKLSLNAPTSKSIDLKIAGTSKLTIDENQTNIGTGIIYKTTTTATNYTALTTDYMILVTSTAATRTISLPAVAGLTDGKTFIVKDASCAVGTNGTSIVIDPNGAELIDNASTATINYDCESRSIVKNGSSWYIF